MLGDKVGSGYRHLIVSIWALIIGVIMYRWWGIPRRWVISNRYLVLAALLIVIHPSMLLAEMSTQIVDKEITAPTAGVSAGVRLVL